MNSRDAERAAYLLSRSIGDARAARRGPDVLAKRLIRRTWHRELIRVLRKGGLW